MSKNLLWCFTCKQHFGLFEDGDQKKTLTMFYLHFLLKFEWTNIGTRKMEPIMTESIGKLSNFNVQWTKTFTRIFYAI